MGFYVKQIATGDVLARMSDEELRAFLDEPMTTHSGKQRAKSSRAAT